MSFMCVFHDTIPTSLLLTLMSTCGLLVAQMVKGVHLQHGRPGFSHWVGKIPWKRAWQSTPAFLPGEFLGWSSLVGYSPWGHKESDKTERSTVIILQKELYPTVEGIIAERGDPFQGPRSGSSLILRNKLSKETTC